MPDSMVGFFRHECDWLTQTSCTTGYDVISKCLTQPDVFFPSVRGVAGLFLLAYYFTTIFNG